MVWQTANNAPRDVPLIVQTERGRIFRAMIRWLDSDSGWTWCTVEESDPVPECWTDGVCWTVNADSERSDWPARFMPIPNGTSGDEQP